MSLTKTGNRSRCARCGDKFGSTSTGRLSLFLFATIVGLSACTLPTKVPRSGAEQRAIELAEIRQPGDVTIEELFHVVNYLPRGDRRRAFWFCHAALNPDYPYAETMAVRLGACHRSNAWDCGGPRVTPADRVRGYTWYSYAALFNPAVREKLIAPLQAHMTADELAMARLTTGADLKPEDRPRSMYAFLNCLQYQITPQRRPPARFPP